MCVYVAAALREAAGGARQAAGAGGAGGVGRALHAARRARGARPRAAAAHQRRDRPRHGEDRVAGPRLSRPTAPEDARTRPSTRRRRRISTTVALPPRPRRAVREPHLSTDFIIFIKLFYLYFVVEDFGFI